MKTYTPKASEITRDWHVVDAEGMVLGRMATEVARVLRGKHKPIFAPHIDTGDHVIIVNADKVVLTKDKADDEDGVPPLAATRAASRARRYADCSAASRPTPSAAASAACCRRARSAASCSTSSRSTPAPSTRTPPRRPTPLELPAAKAR